MAYSKDFEGPSRRCKERGRIFFDGYALCYDLRNELAWVMFGVNDHKKRLLDVDSKEMEQVVAQARGGEVLFESNSSERTMIKDGTTAAQAELWKFFG